MRLLLISPEDHDERELPALPRLFAAGLSHYHLRKPAWDRARLAAFLRVLPDEFHPLIVLHTHHDLVSDFPLGGIHYPELRNPIGYTAAKFISRACHDLPSLLASVGHCSRVLLSPVFPSLSKPGHVPSAALAHTTISFALEARTPAQRGTEVVALGGIDATRLSAVRALGFDAAAVLGAVWLRPDPVAAFTDLLAHAR